MAQAKIGEINCFNIVGFLPRKQRRLMADYHPDGVELDATELMGGPFSITAKFIATEEEYETATELLARYAGSEPVTIVKADGKPYENCFIGRDAPGSGVVEMNKVFVISGNQLKVEADVTVSGHIVFASE